MKQLLWANIPAKVLSDEEKSRDITLERFNEFHIKVGEDFLDQVDPDIDIKVFTGWLLSKVPKLVDELLQFLREDPEYLDIMELSDILDYDDDNHGPDLIYLLISEFVNTFGVAKEEININLISVEEYYKGK